MAGMKIKKGDRVVIRAGKDKGRSGVVASADPSNNTVTVEGLNMASRHTKPKAAGEAGSIKEIEQPIHVSNVGIEGPGEKALRVGYKIGADGKKTRVLRGKGGGKAL